MPRSLPADYEAMTAADKLDVLWSLVTSDPYPAGDPLPVKIPGTIARARLLSVSFNRVSFDLDRDEMPAGRKKLLHTWGTVACVTMSCFAEGSPYTGVFATGGRALLRMSDVTGGNVDFTPSPALKFPVDGRPSLNLLLLPLRIRGPTETDPLTGVYSNASEPAKGLQARLVLDAFDRTARSLGGRGVSSQRLPIDELARWHLDGRPVAEPRAPGRIELVPTAAARDAATPGLEWRRRLASLPEGTTLFDVRVFPADNVPDPFGAIRLDTRFVASRWGDERLFFQHHVGTETGTEFGNLPSRRSPFRGR